MKKPNTFMEKVHKDKKLAIQQENINTSEDFFRFAHTQGFKFNQSDWEQLQSAMEIDQLSEDQFEAITAGWIGALINLGLILFENLGKVEEDLSYLRDKANEKLGW